MASSRLKSDNRIRRFSLPSHKWTFEELEDIMEKAKGSLQWTPGEDLTSIYVGIDREEVEFIAHTMRQHTTYFFALSLPIISYADHIVRDTTRLMSLTKEEVELLNWIIGWCHEGGVLDGWQLYQRNKSFSLHQWVCIWCIADTLGMPMLQRYIYDSVFALVNEQDPSPSAVTIKYLLKQYPHKEQEGANALLLILKRVCAFQSGSEIDQRPELFPPGFVKDVMHTRWKDGLKNPGDITASSRPEPTKGKKEEKAREIVTGDRAENSSDPWDFAPENG